MNFQQSISFLENTKNYGSKLGLESIQSLLALLNHPEKELNVIHIAGTNGKGSISNILNNVLLCQGYRVGIFNSPHIISYRETIKVNNKEIPKDLFSKLTSIIEEACKTLVKNGQAHPTNFECITALSLLYFCKTNVDFAIIEVGLGGKYDATNVFQHPLLSIITSISLDHTQFLGNSIEEIAMQKLGIVKENCPLVLAPNYDEVYELALKVCAEKNAPLFYVDSDDIQYTINDTSVSYTDFNISSPLISAYEYKSGLVTPLLGKHQLYNIHTALLAIYVLQKNISITSKSIENGLSKPALPSRCEYIFSKGHFLFDGAHNPSGALALANTVQEYFANYTPILLFGVLADKDIESILSSLCTLSSRIVLTSPISPRAMNVYDLKNIAMNYFEEITIIPDPFEAFQTLKNQLSNTDLLLVTGSFYLTIPTRDKLLHNKA